MNILDRRFKYTNAADSSKPGYLQAKFDAIRAQQAAQKRVHVNTDTISNIVFPTWNADMLKLLKAEK